MAQKPLCGYYYEVGHHEFYLSTGKGYINPYLANVENMVRS